MVMNKKLSIINIIKQEYKTKKFLNIIIDSEITEIDLSYNTNENRKNKKKGIDINYYKKRF